ncbi:MAG: hypothetical protein HC767_06175 [Akkermansiaceae bacterium]|nr:hypothetical protein [Akkermansiaceae bacterium]
MTLKHKIILVICLLLAPIIGLRGYMFYGFQIRKTYRETQRSLEVEMKHGFDRGDYARCVSTMENSLELLKAARTRRSCS